MGNLGDALASPLLLCGDHPGQSLRVQRRALMRRGARSMWRSVAEHFLRGRAHWSGSMVRYRNGLSSSFFAPLLQDKSDRGGAAGFTSRLRAVSAPALMQMETLDQFLGAPAGLPPWDQGKGKPSGQLERDTRYHAM